MDGAEGRISVEVLVHLQQRVDQWRGRGRPSSSSSQVTVLVFAALLVLLIVFARSLRGLVVCD